ncbi:MAG: carboxymuconolactone decarboxylase family protein [Bacteroidetes bacterium]|nr:carboxymuconolactone decarboxylase family protein [Bacteroidota bacterium]
MDTTYKMQLPPVELANANEEQKALLENAKRELKLIPNMYKAMANLPGLLDTYRYGYSFVRKDSGFTPAEQEVIFLTISAENSCTYCVGAHSFLADMVSKVPVNVTDAIRDNTEIPDEKLRALSTFASIMVNKRGNPSPDDVALFLKAGYTEKHILSIILAIAVKTISNYTNHIFHTELDTPFKAREWKGYKIARSVVKFFERKS